MAYYILNVVLACGFGLPSQKDFWKPRRENGCGAPESVGGIEMCFRSLLNEILLKMLMMSLCFPSNTCVTSSAWWCPPAPLLLWGQTSLNYTSQNTPCAASLLSLRRECLTTAVTGRADTHTHTLQYKNTHLHQYKLRLIHFTFK